MDKNFHYSVEAPNAVQLPFRVRIVRTENHLHQAISIRAKSYEKHHPEVAELLQFAEIEDRGQVVLLAERKASGEAIGTMRIETNTQNTSPIEHFLPENSEFTARTIAFITRLAVSNCADSGLIKLTLYKSLLRYCLACQIDWMIVTARPPFDKEYNRLGFHYVYDHEYLTPIPWSGNIPMKIMALETLRCEPGWREENHPIYPFMFLDYTPDVEIFNSLSGAWTRPRTRIATLPTDEQMERATRLLLV